MISRQNQNVFGFVVQDMVKALTYSIGCTLIPVGAFWSLLSGQDVYETLREKTKPIGLIDMSVQRLRVVLRQHKDPVDT
jgi:hypothetical protein